MIYGIISTDRSISTTGWEMLRMLATYNTSKLPTDGWSINIDAATERSQLG